MIVAIIQARLSSSRLPGKILKPLLGVPMLGRQIERVSRAQRLDRIVVATSEEADDNAVEEFCRKTDVRCVRGSLNDVLDRYHKAASAVEADIIVRLTGDCPLSDPEIIDSLIDKYSEGGFDYVSNTLQPTYPDGLDAEVFSRAALEDAFHQSSLPSEREHVTPYIKNSHTFSKFNQENNVDLSSLRWTVDEPADFVLINKVYTSLYPDIPDFTTSDILQLLEANPAWGNLNSSFTRDEGYAKSLKDDQISKSHLTRPSSS
jgi:spore coat polysaccharide biosynthesis protein SpsF